MKKEKNRLSRRYRQARYMSLVIPVITAIILSVGYDVVSLRRMDGGQVVNRQTIIYDMMISNFILVIGLILAVNMAQKALRRLVRSELADPLHKLSYAMTQIQSGMYDYQIPYEDSDPNQEIYDNFNEMSAEFHRAHIKELEINEGRSSLDRGAEGISVRYRR